MGVPADKVTPKVRVAIETLMREVERLRVDVEELKRRNGELEKLTDEDAMLPVVNRRAFVRELSRTMSFAQRYDQPSSLAFFDVNNMKTINDTLGHAAGDAALMHVAMSLLQNVRHSDVVGRLGGDEFGVVLSQVGDEGASIKTEELAEQISSHPVEWEGGNFDVSIAHGYYTFHGAEGADDALDAADKAMYLQKKAAAAG
jgi:diguanylate cyclase (GGDEF)-like protein